MYYIIIVLSNNDYDIVDSPVMTDILYCYYNYYRHKVSINFFKLTFDQRNDINTHIMLHI